MFFTLFNKNADYITKDLHISHRHSFHIYIYLFTIYVYPWIDVDSMKRVPVIYQYDLQYVIFISVLNLSIHH